MVREAVAFSFVVVAACAARPVRWGDGAAADWPHVDNKVLTRRFIKGRYPRFPSVGTREAIEQSGTPGPYRPAVRLCVARNGALALVDVVRTSGSVDVDADAYATVRAWRFRPGDQDECAIVRLTYSPFFEPPEGPRPVLRR